MRSLERCLVWLALGAYFLTGALSVEGVQVCLEPDGHVSLEVVAAGCASCCEEGEGEPEEGEHVDSCPCVDIALAAPVASIVKSKAGVEWLAAARVSGDWREPVPVSATASAFPARPHVLTNSPVELVRSVVLRV